MKPADRDGAAETILEDRMTAITVTTWPEEATRTPNSACVWVAEATVDGRTCTARSRHGAANELARQLVAAGFTDRPMVIRNRGRAGTGTYRSLHDVAKWTFTEGDHPLRRVRYREQPEGLFPVCATEQKCVSSPDYVSLEGREADTRDFAAPAPAPEMRFSPLSDRQECVSSRPVEEQEVPLVDDLEKRPASTRRCEACDGDFLPARPWSRFCSPACRLRAHRSALRHPEDQPRFPNAAP
jgi:hypothetical protein